MKQQIIKKQKRMEIEGRTKQSVEDAYAEFAQGKTILQTFDEQGNKRPTGANEAYPFYRRIIIYEVTYEKTKKANAMPKKKVSPPVENKGGIQSPNLS